MVAETKIIEAICPHCGKTVTAHKDDLGSLAVCSNCSSECYVPSERVPPGSQYGDFEIIRPLGIGSSAEVHLATHKITGQTAAIKIMFGDKIEHQEDLQRFLREARNAADLEHPGIVKIFATGKQGNSYYLALEYVEGDTLEKLLATGGVLKEEEALTIVLDVAEAMNYAWTQKKLIHRDIKPANIILSFSGKAKLMDLGISKCMLPDVSCLTAQDVIIGTPFYMSPEQCTSSREIDFRADIYSLGATFYHLVTEEVPFTGANPMEVIRKHMITPLPNPKMLNPDLSDECVALIFRMMAKSASGRQESWQQLVEEVRALLA